jgi:hypothetical protein
MFATQAFSQPPPSSAQASQEEGVGSQAKRTRTKKGGKGHVSDVEGGDAMRQDEGKVTEGSGDVSGGGGASTLIASSQEESQELSPFKKSKKYHPVKHLEQLSQSGVGQERAEEVAESSQSQKKQFEVRGGGGREVLKASIFSTFQPCNILRIFFD